MVVFIDDGESVITMTEFERKRRRRRQPSSDDEDRFDGCLIPDNSYYLGK